ncbi:DNA-damage-repair/toleration protein DRT111 [Colletotrichum aenigma]|uniref:DNA-damage-repair/toleration protein DRT111 n=1 Tax=Colletotrichum aenigma TaxID=1215731 RepID=UPI0018725655|nr:DNA-damage-repair/toleration protein DRT111 [Colletotrichum aenigma]KAF5507375.1 DNA-damage-repair/toleration protein DRT111 [Colletotrichum aenigma]
MAAPPPPPPTARGGLSLYANLLDPAADSSSATISSAPVRYNQDVSSGDAKDEAAAKKLIDPSLRFQPIRRPQVKSSKPAKPTFPKQIPGAAPSSTTATSTGAATATAAPAPPPKTTLADWTATTEDDDFRYAGPQDRSHQRGGRRKKKKKNHDQHVETNWDDIYDPSKPTNVEEYLRSDERIREVQEWKRLLYRHRRGRSVSDDSDEEDARPATNQFAPPAEYSFVPPPPASPPPPPAASAAAPPPDDATGDDAYARRLALSSSNPPPPPPPADEATISRAPVRYTRQEPSRSASASPPPTLGLGASSTAAAPDEDADAPRSNRPGQAGFAQRLMSKYGWTKGSGLGADEGGIVNPLRVQVEKRKKKSDAEGGGWADPANRAKILGGRRKDAEGDGGGKFGGPMSEVIVLQHMLDNMEDLQGEIANGLGQEIGEECGEKYGRVERLYIDVENRQVFIRFTDQVSALRAVNELDGRIFNGNTVIPKFYDTAKFEQGIYR